MKPVTPPANDVLLATYRAARYRVYAPGREILLRVDAFDAELAKLLREAWVSSAALLTAWNPHSERRVDAINQSQQARLEEELQAGGYPCLRARNESGVDDSTEWNEDSVLALDLDLPAAHALAARYGQLAFLWIDAEATPRLMVTAASPR